MRNGYFGIWLTLAIVFGVMVAFQLLAGLGVVMAYGIDNESWDPQGVLLINSIAQILTMGGGAWLITASAKQNIGEVFRLNPNYSRASVPIYILLLPMILAAQSLGVGLASLWMNLLQLVPSLFDALKEVQDLLDTSMKEIVKTDTPSELVVGLISIAMVPAMCEELFFRGFMLGNIERSGPSGLRTGIAVVISSIAFGLSHLSPLNMPAIIVLGFVFGWILVKTNDIRVTMTAHFLNNGIIVVALYSLGMDDELSENLVSSEIMPVDMSLMFVVVSGLILFAILNYIGKLADRNSPNSPDQPYPHE